MGIVAVTMLVSAGFMSIWTNFDPAIGPSRLLTAFEAVVLGGLGSLWGTLAGGIVLGVAQTFGAQFDAAWQILAGISSSSRAHPCGRRACSPRG